MKSVALIVALLLTIGCGYGPKSRTVDLGEIESVQIVGGGWGSPQRVQIVTTTESVLIDDIVSVPLHVHCYYDYYADGYRRVWWDGAEYSYRASPRMPVD